MKSRSFKVVRGVPLVVIISLGLMAGIHSLPAAEPGAFDVKGMYVEGCSCSRPCTCELTGVEPMCQGVNAFALTSGRYQGVDLSGVKVAFATAPAKWVRLYVDVKDPKQRDAAVAFAKAYTSSFGKVEKVQDAKVQIDGKGGKYELKVDDGKIMSLVTEPVLGGDNKTPLVYSNIHDALHPTVKQGKTVTGAYHDGTHKFELKDSNAFFNEDFSNKGKM
ncbi:MAG TPA: DUF1326 domain-containing protein [Verrucomicrobiae bacterium]|nr:DUF1326 domain-containing protein [Verrucomicrobiae bacterium]